MSSPSRVAAVVVDFHAGSALTRCIDSLLANGVDNIIVVENGTAGSTLADLDGRRVHVVVPGRNLGYGGGVNRGAAFSGPNDYLLVSNPDVVLHDGAVALLVAYLDANDEVGIVGPTILRPDGSIYPSQRVFPNVWLAGVHALLGPLWPTNPATNRYRAARADGSVDWVSGACFLIRRSTFEIVGGFDERYFMFAEDMALCWSLSRRGFRVATLPEAIVTHIEGLSRRQAPRAMVRAHHRSAIRFEWQTARGLRRLLAPLAIVVLGVRLLIVQVVGPRG